MKNRICLYSPPFAWIRSYCQIIDIAAQCGLSAIECLNNLEFAVPDLEAARRLKSYADSKGIRFACFSVFIDLTGDDREMMLEALKDYAKIAAILGAPYLHHTIAPDFNDPKPHLFETYFQRGLEAVREVYDYAASLGVKAVYEDQGYVFNGVKGLSRFFREVGRDVGFVMDMGNIYQVDETTESLIEAFGARADHAHIKDVLCAAEKRPDWLETLHGNYFDCKAPGEGIIDLKQCVRQLEESGYRGYYGLEFSADPGGMEALQAHIQRIASWIE